MSDHNRGSWRRPSGAGQGQGSDRQAGQPPRSELWLSFEPGAVVRVRYRPLGADGREGGGALNIWAGGDIVLHVNPRPHPNHDALVLNSHLGGGWGPEERPDGYPLHEGEVVLSVWAGPEGFHIQAAGPRGGTPFCHCYAYRHEEERRLDRITIDLPGVAAVEVRTEL